MKQLKLSLAALACAAVVGCGGDAGPSAASGTVTQVQAQALRAKLDTLVTSLDVTNLQNPAGLVPGAGVTASSLKPFENDPFAACTTITPNALADIDQDQISKEKNYKFSCNNIPEGNRLVTKTGTVEIRDLDDNLSVVDGGGYSFVYDMEYYSPDAWTGKYKGFYRFEKIGRTLTYSSEFSSSFTETHSGQDIVGSWESNYKHALTPTDASQPWAGGEINTDGYYRVIIKGDDGTGNILDWDFTFKMVSNSLVYESKHTSNCISYYKSGSLEFTDASNNVMKYEYSCDKYTYSFNGQVLYSNPAN